MKHGMAISAVCHQLKLVCDRIDTMTMDIEQFEQNNSDLVDTYVDLRMDELEHAQMLTLRLTEMISQSAGEEPEANTDEGGSVFAPGELTTEVVVESEEENVDCVEQK